GRRRGRGPRAGGNLARTGTDAARALHACHPARPGDRPGIRGAGEPRLHGRVRRGLCPRRGGGRARGPDSAGSLPHGARRAPPVLRGGDSRWAREPPRHPGGRAARRAERRRRLRALLAHPRQDRGRGHGGAGPGDPGARPLRRGGSVTKGSETGVLALHVAALALLAGLQFLLPPFHHGMLARIMVLAAYTVGYNVLLGYTGLMSLGHAMFFAAGMYGARVTLHPPRVGTPARFASGIGPRLVVAPLVGLLTLRTTGPAFLIVTMMLAQAFYLTTLYFNEATGGDQGFILSGLSLEVGGRRFALAEPAVKYNVALVVFAACF